MNLKRNLPKNVLDKSWPTPPPSLCEVGMTPGMWEGNPGLEDCSFLGCGAVANTIFSWVSHPFLKFPSIFLLTNSVPSVAVIILHLLELVYLLKAKYCRKSQLPYPKDCLDWRYSWKEGRAQQCTEEGSWCLFPILKQLEKSQGKPSYRKAKNQLLII